MHQLRRTFLILACITLLTASCKSKTPETAMTPEQKKISEALAKSSEAAKVTVVAKVNGAAITALDLMDEMNSLVAEKTKEGTKIDKNTDAQIRNESLERLIYRELAVQYARKAGIVILPNEIDTELKRIKAELKTDEAYRQKLKMTGMTEEMLRKHIERNMTVDMITEKEIFMKVRFDPEQAKKQYDKQRDLYRSRGLDSYEKARPVIERELMTASVQKREDEWVAEMKKSAKVEIMKEGIEKIHAVAPGAAAPDRKDRP